jgi:hypothetical protein
MEENSMRFKMRRAEMERYIWKALRRLVLVALVFTAVVGLFGYPAMAQDQTGAGTNLPPPTTTVIPPNNPFQIAILRWYPANLTWNRNLIGSLS